MASTTAVPSGATSGRDRFELDVCLIWTLTLTSLRGVVRPLTLITELVVSTLLAGGVGQTTPPRAPPVPEGGTGRLVFVPEAAKVRTPCSCTESISSQVLGLCVGSV